MADTSHPDSPDAIHYNMPEQRVRHRSASIGLTALCIVLLGGVGFLTFKLNQQNRALTDVRAQLERTNSDVTSARADLAKANSKSTDLQTQLDQAHRQTTDVQAVAKKNEALAADLQSQLGKAQADLQSEQQKSQAEAKDAQAQVAKANDNSSDLRRQLTVAQSQISDLKGQIAKADAAAVRPAPAVAPAARTLPLASEFKKSFFGSSFTLQLKNQGTDSLKLNIQVTGSEKTPPSQAATIEGGGTFKLEGLAPGAKITVSGDGFESLNLTAQ